MTALWNVLALVIEIVRWLAGPPVSLADAARREALRREAVGPSVASLTGDTLPAPVSSVVDAPVAGRAPTPTSRDRDEAAWRERVQGLRRSIDDATEEIAVTRSRLAALETQAVAVDDPARQAVLRQQAGTARRAIDGLERRLETTRRALDAVHEEARRMDIPPGWLR
jgi:hypothetical protein